MKRLIPLLFIFLLIGALPYFPEFTWDAPTERVDGTLLNAATDLSEYRLYCDGAVVATPMPEDLSYISQPDEFSVGQVHECYMTAVDLALNESVPSNLVNFTVVANPPKPPVLRFN